MYEALDSMTHEVYSANNVAELRMVVETSMPMPEDLPDQYFTSWSNSRCLTFLVQAGYIIPYSGPDWWMDLAADHPDGGDSPDGSSTTRSRSEFIELDGSKAGGRANITFWKERNHVRLVFEGDEDQIFGEVFMTEESLRNLWIAIGRHIGLSSDGLFQIVMDLPSPQLHTPQIPPERYDVSGEEGFNIFKAINKLDIDFDDEE